MSRLQFLWGNSHRMLRTRRFSFKRIIFQTLGFVVTLQAIVVLILQFVSVLRRQQRYQGSFPHLSLEEVNIGKNRVQIYDYGRDLYAHMLQAIDDAHESIYLETYIWKDDVIGQEFKQKLTCKANQGVNVYVIFDSFANLVVPGEFKIFPSNIHVLKYQSFKRPWHIFDPRRYALDHRKMLVVDGSTAFSGGFNLGSLYETTWRDTHLRMNGPAAAHLSQSFIDFWNQHTPKKDHITRHYPRHFDPLINIRGTSAMRLTFPIRDMYIEAIDKAERSIQLSNAYFVPDRVLLDALNAAAQRGVDVQILVPWVSNHVIVDWLSSVGNYEINVEVYSNKLANQMEELFKCDISNSLELTLEQWLKRPWYAILGERILSPLRALL